MNLIYTFFKKMIQIKFILVQMKCMAKILEILISIHKMIQLLIRA